MIIPNFDPIKARDDIVDWIKIYFAENGTPDTKAIIGISGGKDSTVAAALLARALGPERVIGVLMPFGEQSDIKDARAVVEALGIESMEINIRDIMFALCKAIPGEMDSKFHTNTPARVRMTVLYGVAAIRGGRVCHTGNKSELYVGYTTKYGDLAGDFSLFYNFTATEVIEIGKTCLELPEELVVKTPSDGMSGQSDEEKLGFTYRELDNYILNKNVPFSAKAMSEITKKHNLAKHKNLIIIPAPARRYKLKGTLDERYPDWII